MSLPKSWRGVRVGRVPAQLVVEERRVEHVDAHARQRHVGIAGDAGRILGLLQERDDAVVLVDVHHAEAGGFHARHLEAADGHVGLVGDVLLEHDLVVHLVDVVAREHDDMVDAVVLEDVDVLVDGVGGALVPLRLRDALARRQDVEALVALRAQEVPAALQMADQAVRLVLRGDPDPADARVQRVGEREVDDPGLAAEIDRGLGAPVGELRQPGAAPSGQDECERIAAESAGHGRLRHDLPPL